MHGLLAQDFQPAAIFVELSREDFFHVRTRLGRSCFQRSHGLGFDSKPLWFVELSQKKAPNQNANGKIDPPVDI